MTPAERNELVDRATRVALSDDPTARLDFEEYLISRVAIEDLILIRDGARRTIGVHLIYDLMLSWSLM
jgi:hypothetical protein